MKIVFICVSFLFLFLFQSKITAVDQVKNMKSPVIVAGKYFASNKMDGNTFMVVVDGNNEPVSLNKDSTLLNLLKRYNVTDTIK